MLITPPPSEEIPKELEEVIPLAIDVEHFKKFFSAIPWKCVACETKNHGWNKCCVYCRVKTGNIVRNPNEKDFIPTC